MYSNWHRDSDSNQKELIPEAFLSQLRSHSTKRNIAEGGVARDKTKRNQAEQLPTQARVIAGDQHSDEENSMFDLPQICRSAEIRDWKI